MSESLTADVVIVGAGIAGAGIAAALGGRRHVVLLEREAQAGYHATGRSAAVFVPNYGDGPIRMLTAAGAAALRDPDPEFWPHPILKPRGMLRLVAPDGDTVYAAQMRQAEGVHGICLREARDLFPLMDPRRFVAASYERDVLDIDVDGLLQGYLRKARRLGTEIVFGCEVTGIERDGGRWRVETDDGAFDAPIVVNAAGAWADDLAGRAHVRPLGFRPLRRSMAVIDLPADAPASETWPFVVRFPLDWYAKPDAGWLIVSPAEEEPMQAHDAYADDMVIAEGLHRFEQDVTMTVEKVRRSWAGLRTHSADGYPVVGFDPNAEGFFWLAGQGGFGVQTAPALSDLAAALICEEVPSCLLPPGFAAQLAPTRF
ncbi:MAG: FAD-binding oxidoreductase [Minwuiales bacterium]|nr:FAD-binding oxidoreductase [Minwuiales bacterium]